MIHTTSCNRPIQRSLCWIAAAVVSAISCFGSPGVMAQNAAPAKPEAQNAAPPKLVVILVVDQMRVNYLTWYAANYSSGLARLIREGAWFTEAAYPYLNTITCAGHSTIGTGSFPYRHGMILNNWYDPKTGKSPYCTDDATETEISYNGLPSVHGDSAKLLMEPAIGEQIMKKGGRSVALSFKPRSAIPLTGHRSTAVVWFDERGGWTTSTAFTKAPVPFLKAFIDANPIGADYDKVWDRSMPLSSYQGPDDGKGEGKVSGWTDVFPHPLAVPDGKLDAAFYARWQRSPFADEYLGRMAAAAIDSLELGRGTTTDFLGVSFSATDCCRTRLRTAQPRDPGPSLSARSHDWHAARPSRRQGRQGQLRARDSAPTTASPRFPSRSAAAASRARRLAVRSRRSSKARLVRARTCCLRPTRTSTWMSRRANCWRRTRSFAPKHWQRCVRWKV